MITEREQLATKLSATNADYYKVWEELLSVAGKLSERWSPESTNENDPGVILLKVLTACSDKLSYMVDKNILEAFMPSASQMESMRKLCSMLGYTMKYYRSATGEATISFIGDKQLIESTSVIIPKYTNIKDVDNEINYLTTEQIVLTENSTSKPVPIIEGSLQECSTDTDGVITADMLDDNFRYYLPETFIAENGIFITSVNKASEDWKQVKNLNTQPVESKVFKFGFDSQKGIPFIQFPDDINSIIKDGVYIRYIRTNGVNGNITARRLSAITKPELWSSEAFSETYKDFSVDQFSATNLSSITNGADPEGINQAYNNYKKIIGTFDTLVTCRDYMNKIYELTESVTNTTSLVSNAIVADIKDDINRAVNICSFNKFGMYYVDRPIYKNVEREAKTTEGKTVIIQEKEPLIDNFELRVYPFNTYKNLNTLSDYKNSFLHNTSRKNDIVVGIEDNKTISHKFRFADEDDEQHKLVDKEVVCIKNYLRLNARITTTYKVNSVEGADIIENIKKSIFNKFNLRNVDFGEEIPYDDILDCIENADERIKNVSLDEPILVTKFLTADNQEYYIASQEEIDALPESEQEAAEANKKTAQEIYNKLAVRNVLAGKVELFNYDKNFGTGYDEIKYEAIYEGSEPVEIKPIYPDPTSAETNKFIKRLETQFTLKHDDEKEWEYNLLDNEVIQFRSPNFRSTVTYPAYVNYYISLKDETDIANAGEKEKIATPATFTSLWNYFGGVQVNSEYGYQVFIGYINSKELKPIFRELEDMTEEAFYEAQEKYYVLFENKNTNQVVLTWDGKYAGKSLWGINIKDNWILYNNFVKESTLYDSQKTVGVPKVNGIYKGLASDSSRELGKYVDISYVKYQKLSTAYIGDSLKNFFIPEIYEKDEPGVHTKDGLGFTPEYTSLKAGEEYEIKDGEYLLINYTSSNTDSETQEKTETVVNKYYGPGTIIRSKTDLTDSKIKARLENDKYPKKDGFDFVNCPNAGPKTKDNDKDVYSGDNPEGMFTLGANDQIEIREPIKVTFDSKSSPLNLYFILNQEIDNKGYVYLFNESDYVEGGDAGYFSKFLEADEYLFYTDNNKLSIAYYGNGTEIRLYTDKTKYGSIKKPKDSIISAADIEENGLNVIPWISVSIPQNNRIEVWENKYESIVKGNKLETISNLRDENGTSATEINNKWLVCDSATYLSDATDTTGETEKQIKKINISGNQYSWRVRTKLELNAGPDSYQTIHENDQVKIFYQDSEESDTLKVGKNDEGKIIPLSFKTNYYAISGSGSLDTTRNLYDRNGIIQGISETTSIKDFKIKTFEQQDVVKKDTGEIVHLNNFSNRTWSKLIVEPDSDTNEPITTLNINFSKGKENKNYVLIMIYYLTNSEITGADSNGIYLTTDDKKTDLTIFGNIFNNSFIWWKGYDTSEKKYYLKKGMNVIKIDDPCKLNIYRSKNSDADETEAIIFDNINIVSVDDPNLNQYGINYKLLDYQGSAADDTIIPKIIAADPDHEFYYNNPVDNSLAIDINTKAKPTPETLRTPYIWYNYNNVNNKFVVSEIDGDYLSDGIVIARTSKL